LPQTEKLDKAAKVCKEKTLQLLTQKRNILFMVLSQEEDVSTTFLNVKL
jgi:hypothetical protein